MGPGYSKAIGRKIMNLFLLTQTAHHEVAKHAAEVGQHVAEHAEHAEHGSPHVVNWITLIAKALEPSSFASQLLHYEKVIYSAIIVFLITWFSLTVYRNMKLVPGRLQVILESVVMWLDDLVCGVTGQGGRQFTPFVGALFIYILVSNLFGLVPLQNSATAYITTTAPLAICVFFYVQWVGITKNGLGGYIFHLMGSPKDVIGWALLPLNFPLHILGEFSKPLSLMFRLYGNVMAGHILVAVFLGLGLSMLKSLHIPIGVPLHFPFLFLEILVGLIQAFVFSLLTTVYIAMMLPHDQEEHAEAHA
ncbi:MAG: F-type H+-transporting ATPase subunit a [Candidatus Omnitrophota bacterium]|jgi:F-type H+-transporting ATPase subunit a